MLGFLFAGIVHGLAMEQRCSQLNIPLENCMRRRNLDLLLSSANYPILRDKKCDRGECMTYLYKDECDVCDSQECFRMCQGKKSNDKEFLEFVRSIAERSRINSKYEILDNLRHGSGDVKTVTVMENPSERENVKAVTASQSELPSVVTVTQNEIKTVTVEPPSRHETKTSEKTRQEECVENCERKPHGRGRNPSKTANRRETTSEESDSVSPTVCTDRNECGSTKSRSDKTANKMGGRVQESAGGSKGGDVTVTRVVERTTTLERPLTLFREVTTTITKEKPIINYKVTTFTDTSTRVESMVITKTETRVFTVGGGGTQNYYQSTAGQRSYSDSPEPPGYGVNKTVGMPSNDLAGQIPAIEGRDVVTITRCDENAVSQAKTTGDSFHQGVVTITRCETGTPTQPKTVDNAMRQSIITVTRDYMDASSYVRTVTVDSHPHQSVVTVTKSPDSAVSMFENVVTTTILGPAISVVTVNAPTVSTITAQSVSLITTVITISPDMGVTMPAVSHTTARDSQEKTKTAFRAVSRGCEIQPDAKRPRTICRFQNVPKEFLRRGMLEGERNRTKKRRTVYRTVYSTEGSASECEKVVTTTVFV